jgi:hypothetical protein
MDLEGSGYRITVVTNACESKLRCVLRQPLRFAATSS